MRQIKLWGLAAILIICGTAAFASCTANDDNPSENYSTIQRIQERGKLLVGTTGDYRPLSYREANGNYWGFGIEMAEKIAKRIGVGIEYVQTSWPTLTADVHLSEQNGSDECFCPQQYHKRRTHLFGMCQPQVFGIPQGCDGDSRECLQRMPEHYEGDSI